MKKLTGDVEAKKAIDNMLIALNQGLLADCISYISVIQSLSGAVFLPKKEYLEDKIKELLAQQIISNRMSPEKIVCAELGNTAGMIGAVYHFLEKHPTNK